MSGSPVSLFQKKGDDTVSTKSKKITSAENWEYAFENLPRYYKENDLILEYAYELKETKIEYESSSNSTNYKVETDTNGIFKIKNEETNEIVGVFESTNEDDNIKNIWWPAKMEEEGSADLVIQKLNSENNKPLAGVEFKIGRAHV